MDQFAFAGLESFVDFVDFAETLRLSELAEEYRNELVPAAEAAMNVPRLGERRPPFQKGRAVLAGESD